MGTMDKTFLTVKEAAEELGVEVKYVRRLFEEGKLTGWRGQGKNGRMHVSSVSIEKFTESSRNR